ncbi:MAG TPA: hypothetical protein VFA33_04530 [Bryobacteraceae bacterium]|nr:hypothetical protein [Bryobacteraceae bacterium]
MRKVRSVLLSLGGLGVAQMWLAYAQQAPQPPQPQPAPQQEERSTGDGVFSVGVYYWLTSAPPDLRGGHASFAPNPANFDFPGNSKYSPAAEVSIPAGRENTLRFSYFRTLGRGDTTATGPLTLFGTDFSQGDYLVTRYNIQNFKISFDYLSFPFPLSGSRLRVKTLWEVQYTGMQSSIDAPLKPLLTDSSGNVISNTAAGSKWFIYPTLGMGIEYSVSRNFRLEARASGFMVPSHATIWDTEGSAGYRMGRVEALVGAKAFHFKTSIQADQYYKATLSGVYAGLRWYPKF